MRPYIFAQTPRAAWVLAINDCLYSGETSAPRGIRTRELFNAQLDILQPWCVPFAVEGRVFRDFIGAAEAVQLVGGFSDPAWMVRHVKAFDVFREDDGSFHGAYGLRIAGHLGNIVSLLEKDPDSRQAVLSVYASDKDIWIVPPKDVPCTQGIQFLVRGGKVHMRVTMRSNDVWLGLPYDIIQFAALQGAVAAALDLPMGRYCHSVGSLHLYERNTSRVQAIIDNEGTHPRIGDTWEYEPMWQSDQKSPVDRLDEITWRCQMIRSGNPIPGKTTSFEDWLAAAVKS